MSHPAPTEKAGERRRAPRYPVDATIFASVAGQTVRLLNISRLGVAINGSGLAPGTRHLLQCHLDSHHITLAIEILECSTEDRLHACFVEPDSDALQQIDRYLARETQRMTTDRDPGSHPFSEIS